MTSPQFYKELKNEYEQNNSIDELLNTQCPKNFAMKAVIDNIIRWAFVNDIKINWDLPNNRRFLNMCYDYHKVFYKGYPKRLPRKERSRYVVKLFLREIGNKE